MADFIIKQGDRLPALVRELTDANGDVVDLSTGVTSVTFSMRPKNKLIAVVANGAATITDAAGGVVQYAWANGDTGQAGAYEGEFSVNYSNGQSLTFPNLGYIKIWIEDQVA